MNAASGAGNEGDVARRALGIWLPLAGAVHLALVVAASRLPLPAAPSIAVLAEPIEIAAMADEEERSPAAGAPLRSPAAADAPVAPLGGPARALPAARPPAPVAEPIVAAEQGSWAFSAVAVAPPPDVLAGRPIFVAGVIEAPPVPSAAPTSRTGGIAEALDTRDHGLGLGHGGAVLSAIEEVARVPGESAPEGHATYDVTVHRSGAVSVSVRKATDASWDTLREPIVRSVAAKHVPLPSNAEGMRFVVEIDARVQWPDGKRPANVGVKGLASTGQDGARDQPGLSFQNVPMIGVVREGKVCNVGIAAYPGFVAVGGSCSPENIGQPAARIVHGRIASESRL